MLFFASYLHSGLKTLQFKKYTQFLSLSVYSSAWKWLWNLSLNPDWHLNNKTVFGNTKDGLFSQQGLAEHFRNTTHEEIEAF